MRRKKPIRGVAESFTTIRWSLTSQPTEYRQNSDGTATQSGHTVGRTGCWKELERGVVLLIADRIALFAHYVDPLMPTDVPGSRWRNTSPNVDVETVAPYEAGHCRWNRPARGGGIDHRRRPS